ncbi:DNA polymerase III subunit alpha [Lactobacillaceae bacterium Scapto_B20]
MGFVPLQIISGYSLLQSTISIPKLVQTAKQRGYQSLALTDLNVMYGAVEFYNACQKENLHALIGMTLSLKGIVNQQHDFDVILLAKDQVGYRNLMQISTAKLTNSNDDDLSLSMIKPWLTHLMMILPSDGELIRILSNDNQQLVERYFNEIEENIPLTNVRIGINPTQDQKLIIMLKQLSATYGVALAGVDSVEYLDSEDYFATKVLRSIENPNQKTIAVSENNKPGRNWLRPVEIVQREYQRKDLTEAMNETEKIAKICNVTIEKQPTQLPQFETPDNLTSNQYLKQLCQTGLKKRIAINQIPNDQFEKYQERLDQELAVISRMGFDDYFLIVWDVIKHAHSIGITTGPGRGSAAGSLVAYVLTITDVDPIAYDLLFERFLNEERAQMPDIDLDIPDDRRDDVLNYVHDRYGHDRVAQIITFDTLGAKQALRDINRVFGISNDKANQWSKAVPSQLHIDLQTAYQQSQGLQMLVQRDDLSQLVFKTALKLEGLPRHFSTHAAGVVLSNQPLVNLSPLQNGNDQLLMTQYSKNYAEEVGLLKIDFLGLRNLSLLAAIIDQVRTHRDANFDIHQINVNDAETLRLFQLGDTNGIFQFESNGIKNVLRQVKPDRFSLVAVVDALYRPGPMQNIDTFIKRKDGVEPISYPDKALRSILEPTYGIIVYQEQVMQVAAVMGGFSLGQADILRRAMSKKKQSVMDSMRVKFLSGAKQKGFSEQAAQTTFDYIDRFANYGFNKSHAVAYSKMAFQLAYLKTHFPREFFVCLFNAELGNKEKIRTFLLEAKRRQIQILPPNINESVREFSLQDQKIVFGLAAIRGLRSDFIAELLTLREQNGIFKNFENLLQRIDTKFRKTDVIEPLIYSGALDCFGYKRSELIASLPEFLESINLSGSSIELLQSLQPKIKYQDEFSIGQLLDNEQKYLGVYLSNYPTEQFDMVIDYYHAVRVDQLPQVIDQKINAVLYINRVKKIRTKKGEQMAFVTGSDPIGEVDIVVFPQAYKRFQTMLVDQRVLMVSGKVENRRGLQIVADQIVPAANLQGQLKKTQSNRQSEICFLKITHDFDNQVVKQRLFELIKSNPGNCRILIYWADKHQKQVLAQRYSISNNADVQTALQNLLGVKNVVYQKR